jgi:hypothetical protein
MAKQIIIVSSEDMHFECVFWAAVPTARQPFYANPNARSRYTGATQGEIDALKAGAVVEKSVSYDFAPNTTAQAMMDNAQADFTAYQAEIDAHNPWALAGSYYDGATWTFTGVA